MGGGAVGSPDRDAAHCVQSSHHEPDCRTAAARQSAGAADPSSAAEATTGAWPSAASAAEAEAAGSGAAASYQAFGPGGLTMPAMWPPLERTYLTSPPSRRVAW